MSIKTDCWILDISFYRWAAKRLTYFLEHEHGRPNCPTSGHKPNASSPQSPNTGADTQTRKV